MSLTDMMEVEGRAKRQPASEHNTTLNVLFLFKISNADFMKVPPKSWTPNKPGEPIYRKRPGEK